MRRFFCCDEIEIQNDRRNENDDNVEGNIDAYVAYALTYQSVSDLMVYRAVIRLHLSFSSCYGGLLVPRVLVVDDVPMVVVAIEVCFQRRGFKVTVADGSEAAFCARMAPAFDVMPTGIFRPSIEKLHRPSYSFSGYSSHSLPRPGCASRSRRTRWRPSMNVQPGLQ
jgi:hypothetical protein